MKALLRPTVPLLLGAFACFIPSCTPPNHDTFNPAYERIPVQDDIYRPTDRELDDYEGWQNRGCHSRRHYY